MKYRTAVRRILALGIFMTFAGHAAAQQAYPSKPIRIIVPFPPGGGGDIIVRALAPHMAGELGQQVLIDYRAGASGIIGADLAAKAAPDGYTLVLGNTGILAINPSLFPKLPYDPVSDFAPISLIGIGPNALVTHPSLPVRTIKDLIALAKQRPGKLSYASSGIGGAPHLAGELFKSMAGVDIVHIPYKGAAPATVDVVGGHVPIMFAGLGAALPYIQAGRLRALGVAGKTRSSQLPAVPAIGEVLPGFAGETWFGILAPRNTPSQIVERLSTLLNAVANRRDVRDQLLSGGYEVALSTPKEFAEHVVLEIKKWAPVIKSSGVTAQ